jgi:hypothetical protein
MALFTEDERHACIVQKTRGKNIGSVITITVVEVRGNKIRLGIDAPEDVPIFRAELYDLLAKIGVDAGEPAEHELAQAF